MCNCVTLIHIYHFTKTISKREQTNHLSFQHPHHITWFTLPNRHSRELPLMFPLCSRSKYFYVTSLHYVFMDQSATISRAYF